MLSASLQAAARRTLRSKSLLLPSRTRSLRHVRLATARATPQLARWYTTEKIINHRLKTSLSALTPNKGIPATLYDATQERENCGVGMVASLKSVASRKVVMDANEMLVRMSHRGGVGCCPASGDGAGELL
jgi:hypothetical protein